MTEPINIPIDMEVRAKATLNLTNTETGEVQTMSMGAPEGMILNHYLDWAMERGLGLLGTTTFNRCYLGTGDTPVQPTDTGLSGSQLAMSSDSVLTKGLENIQLKFVRIAHFEGIRVGNIGQIAITPDEDILLLGTAATEEVPGLRAFKIDKQGWSLELLEVPDFEEFSVLGSTPQRFACSENYLFVAMNSAPWGRLYKREGYNFLHVGDLSGHTGIPNHASFSPDENYLIAGNKIYKINLNLSQNILESTSMSIDDSEASTINIFVSNTELCSARGYRSEDAIILHEIQEESLIQTQSFDAVNTQGIPWIVYEDGIVCIYFYAVTNSIMCYLKRGLEGTWELDTQNAPGSVATNFIYIPDYKSFVLTGGSLYVNNLVGYSSPFADEFTPSRFASAAFIQTENVLVYRVPVEEGDSGVGFYKLREPVTKQSYARKWTFPAGTGTGVVNEIAIQATTGTGQNGNNRYFLRFVLPEGFEKTDLHQLEVEVEAEIENPGVWEGVIPGGSRDESDVSYRITMSENQFSSFITTGYNNLSSWFGTSGTPNVRIGTSNEETDLVLDRENIRGEEIQYISSTAIREVIPYVSGSLERTIRLFLEIDQGNGKIGEIVFGNRFCRVTFDPPLNKYDPEGVDEGRDPSTRLYMNLVFGWKREGE